MSSPPTFATTAGMSGAATNPEIDFVGTDFEALASHMRQCSSAQGQWSAARGRLQWVHAVVSGRIVTTACIAAVTAVSLIAFA